MNCPSCYSASSVRKTIDAGNTLIRKRACTSCPATWTTEENLREGSLVTSPGQIRPLVATRGHGRPPTARIQPPVAAAGHGGVRGGLPSGSDPGPIRSPDPSQPPDQEEPRAREAQPEPKFWTAYDWRRKYSNPWCDKYGGTAIGGDGAADAKLADLLAQLTMAERLAAQARAPQMFAEFLAEGGEPAKARHRWAFFVGRFPALRLPPAPPPRSGGARPGYVDLDQGPT